MCASFFLLLALFSQKAELLPPAGSRRYHCPSAVTDAGASAPCWSLLPSSAFSNFNSNTGAQSQDGCSQPPCQGPSVTLLVQDGGSTRTQPLTPTPHSQPSTPKPSLPTPHPQPPTQTGSKMLGGDQGFIQAGSLCRRNHSSHQGEAKCMTPPRSAGKDVMMSSPSKFDKLS